jgi:RNA polymerase sigma factor for flagellar operon FliA
MVAGPEVRTNEEREALILAHLPEVHAIARRMMRNLPGTVQFEDLVSAGTLGLISAVDKFDLRQDVQLSTFAYYRIRGAMLDTLRSADNATRRIRRRAKAIEQVMQRMRTELGREPESEEIAQAMSVSYEEYQAWLLAVQNITLEYFDAPWDGRPGSPTVADRVPGPDRDSPSQRLAISEARRILNSAIRDLPERERQVLSLYYQHEVTPGEIAQIMNLKLSRVSQLKAQGLLRLRSVLDSRMSP